MMMPKGKPVASSGNQHVLVVNGRHDFVTLLAKTNKTQMRKKHLIGIRGLGRGEPWKYRVPPDILGGMKHWYNLAQQTELYKRVKLKL